MFTKFGAVVTGAGEGSSLPPAGNISPTVTTKHKMKVIMSVRQENVFSFRSNSLGLGINSSFVQRQHEEWANDYVSADVIKL